jgi:hypothetical protein
LRLSLDYSCVFVARLLRWRQITAFEQIVPDREATGDLLNRLAMVIPRTRASGVPRLNAIKPDGYWRLFHL